MVRSVLNRTGKIIKKFSDFYFSSYHRKLGWFFFQKNDTKMTITRKIKIGEFWNLVLLSIQPIADLSSKFKKLKKKNWILIPHHGFSSKSIFFTKFQNSPIFIFRVMVILVRKSPQFSMITRKIKIGEFFYYISRYIQITLITGDTFEGGGWSACPSLGHSPAFQQNTPK